MALYSPRSYPESGDVLVASPSLLDPNFSQSLVYLCEVSEHGALGVILNRPLGRELPHPILNERQIPLHFGGPVQADHFHVMCFKGDPWRHSLQLMPTVEEEFQAGQLEDPHCRVRGFVGYAGWSAGQLEEEVDRRDWMWTAPDDIMLGQNPTPELWRLLSEGDMRWKDVRDFFPRDPERN